MFPTNLPSYRYTIHYALGDCMLPNTHTQHALSGERLATGRLRNGEDHLCTNFKRQRSGRYAPTYERVGSNVDPNSAVAERVLGSPDTHIPAIAWGRLPPGVFPRNHS